jgi:hypothetical protein
MPADDDGISESERGFWEGQNIFSVMAGAGFCIVAEHPLWGGILICVGIVGFFASRRNRPMKSRAKRSFFWGIAIVITWFAIGYDYYDRHHAILPEFDDGHEKPVLFDSGMKAPDFCQVAVNGNLLMPYKDKYNVAFACYLWDGTQDQLDLPNLLISEVHDIGTGDLPMRVEFTPQFDWRFNHSEGMVNYMLMLVPKDLKVTQFQTLRQARALGVKLPWLESRSITRKTCPDNQTNKNSTP